jgi:hypothetical protein
MRGDRAGGNKAFENAEIEKGLKSEYIMPEIIKASSSHSLQPLNAQSTHERPIS